MTVFILIIPAICIIGAYDSENSSFCFVLCVIYSNFVIKKLYENMGRGKLEKFADMERYENVFEYPYHVMEQKPFDMKGQWRERLCSSWDADEANIPWNWQSVSLKQTSLELT